MTSYKDGDEGFELLRPPERSSRVGAEQQRAGVVVERHDFSMADSSWGARRRGRALARTLEGQTGGFKIAKRHAEAVTAFENARQELDLAVARRGLLPLMLETETIHFQTEIEKGRGAWQAAIDTNADLRARRFEHRELEATTHELALTRVHRLILEEKIAIQRLNEQLSETESAAEPSGRSRQDSDPLADFVHTEPQVQRARAAAAQVIDAIRSAAAAERRALTQQERDLIAMYEAALLAAEEHIRRGEAADF